MTIRYFNFKKSKAGFICERYIMYKIMPQYKKDESIITFILNHFYASLIEEVTFQYFKDEDILCFWYIGV